MQRTDRGGPTQNATRSGAPRLHFLDGLRSLAALYVLLFHETTVAITGPVSAPMRVVRAVMSRGHLAVVFFIVLSGFSLMLPLARAGSFQLPNGFATYIRRRARRILPPYYAALILSIAMIVVVRAKSGSDGGHALDAALSRGSLVSHLFLVHNVAFDWAYRIDGPMWSVATEWQIYFVFPALLLPLWRRTGPVVTVIIAWLIGCLPFFLLPPTENFYWACPWFVGSFAFGMASAVIWFSPTPAVSTLARRLPWGWLTAVPFIAIVALSVTGRVDAWPSPVVDLVVSVFAFSWINACAQRSSSGAQSGPLLRALGSRTLVFIAGFSYSLYLLQHPVLRFSERVCARLHVGGDAMVAAQLFLVTPTVMVFAWLFSELFEKPFLGSSPLLPALRRKLRGLYS